MSNYVLVRHRVTEFAEWKRVFDLHEAKRAEAGLSVVHVLRSADDPHLVVLMLKASDVSRAKAFAASLDVKEAMQKGGVMDRPEAYFLTD